MDTLKSLAQARRDTPTPACEPETFSYDVQVHPADDTSVTVDAPTSSSGTSRTLLSDGNPREEAYLRFTTASTPPSPPGARTHSTHGFVAGYGPTGEHRWSRSLNSWMEPSLLGVQPSGEILVGGAFDGPMTIAGTTYTPVEESDTLWLRLAP